MAISRFVVRVIRIVLIYLIELGPPSTGEPWLHAALRDRLAFGTTGWFTTEVNYIQNENKRIRQILITGTFNEDPKGTRPVINSFVR